MPDDKPDPYTKDRYELAAERWEAARKAKAAAEHMWREASGELVAAEAELYRQEAADGVPAWSHLATVPDQRNCRVPRCRAHLRAAQEAAEAKRAAEPAEDREPAW